MEFDTIGSEREPSKEELEAKERNRQEWNRKYVEAYLRDRKKKRK